MKKRKFQTEIIILIMIIFVVSSSIICREIGDLDEIWNYNISNNIAKGLVPYRDYNTLVTPLLQILAGIILKIIANELITMRVLAVILISAILFLIYKILDLLKVYDSIKIFSLVGIMCLEYKYFFIDYNFFALFLTLIIIYLEVKNIENNTKMYNLGVGFLAGLVCMTKQTIGILVFSAVVGYIILQLIIDKIKNKKSLKAQITKIAFRIIGFCIPVTFFIVYLLATNALNDFIDYAILGIKTFSNKIEYVNLLKSESIIIKGLAIIVPASFIFNFIYSIIKKDNKLFVINCLSIAMFAVAFPISDNIHFFIGSTALFITIIYNVNNILKKCISTQNENKKIIFLKYFINGISTLTVFIFLVSGIYINHKNIKNVKYYSQLEHYKLIPIPEEYENEIKIVDEYIQKSDKKVYILNFDAAIYMIPINRYNKDYDMFLKGNIGSKGEEGQISNIQNEDAKYLIIKDGMRRNWQNPENVRKYIQNNMKYIETISNFDVYENY